MLTQLQHENIILTLARATAKAFETQGCVNPMIAWISKDDELKFNAIQDFVTDAEKQAVADKMKSLTEDDGAQAVAFIVEAWQANVAPEEAKSVKVQELPNAEEVVRLVYDITVGPDAGTSVAHYVAWAKIVRPTSGEAAYLEPWDISCRGDSMLLGQNWIKRRGCDE